MKTIHVTATWKSRHTIEVPDDFDVNDDQKLLQDYGDEIDTTCAELVDWDIREAEDA